MIAYLATFLACVMLSRAQTELTLTKDSYVINLTDENLNDAVRLNDYVLVQFVNKDCPRCIQIS